MPVYAWMPSIGISNLIQIRGFAPQWDGDLLVSSLVDRTLYRVRLDGTRVLYAEPIRTGFRHRDIAQLGDGRILAWTDWERFMILEVDHFPAKAEALIAELPQNVQDTLTTCKECHQLAPGRENDKKISLWGVVGRDISAGDPELKSDSLKDAEGVWSEDQLDAFLADPEGEFPGTTMPDPGLGNARLRRDVIEALTKLTPDAAN